MSKTEYCDTCVHSEWQLDTVHRCNKGHKPRFYPPTSVYDQCWGYKRRCGDYEELIKVAAKMLQRVDYFVSCDDGEDSFNRRWEENGLVEDTELIVPKVDWVQRKMVLEAS